MSNQVTVTLPDHLYELARRWAAITHRDLPDTITDALAIALPAIPSAREPEKPVSALSDEEVLALTKAKISPTQAQRLSVLLDKQREGQLADSERPELLALMQIYSRLWIRQSQALAEAVQRGLRRALEP